MFFTTTLEIHTPYPHNGEGTEAAQQIQQCRGRFPLMVRRVARWFAEQLAAKGGGKYASDETATSSSMMSGFRQCRGVCQLSIPYTSFSPEARTAVLAPEQNTSVQEIKLSAIGRELVSRKHQLSQYLPAGGTVVGRKPMRILHQSRLIVATVDVIVAASMPPAKPRRISRWSERP